MRLRDSLAARQFVAFGAVTLVFAAATILSISRLSQFNGAVRTVTGPQLHNLELTDQWLDAVQESARLVNVALIKADQYEMPEQIAAIKAADARAAEQFRSLQSDMTSSAEKAALEDALAANSVYAPLEERILNQGAAGQIAAARMLLLKEGQAAQLKCLTAIRGLRELERRQMVASTLSLTARYRNSRSILVAMFVLAVIVSAVLGIRHTRAIQRPLHRIIAHFDEIRGGNLNGTIAVNTGGEIGQVLESLQAMQGVLRNAGAHAADCDAQVSAIRRSQAVLELDVDGTIRTANDRFLEAFGYGAQDITGQHYSMFVEPAGRSSTQYQTLWAKLARGEAVSGLQKRLARGGREVWLQSSYNPLLDRTGRPYKVVEIASDVTEQVLMKNALDAAVKQIQTAVEAATEGRLTVRVSSAGVSGPIEAVVTHVNALLDTMMHVVERIKRATAQVKTGANEIARGSANLNQRAEEQVASLERSSASMQGMAGNVRTTADYAEQARQLALAAHEQAQKGGNIVSETVDAMRGIGIASRRIAEIIGVIDEMAFQTNLLALNAAVEAARAGEHGRGFAVVASEVRSLAGRSATAAREIKELIAEGVRRTELGEKLVEQSGHALGEIGMAVKRVTDATARIAEASQAQANGIEQVSEAVVRMEEMTQQNVALVEKTSAATRAITEQVTQLSVLVEYFEVTGVANEWRTEAQIGGHVVTPLSLPAVAEQ